MLEMVHRPGSLLTELGVVIDAANRVHVNFAQAERIHVHHTQMPVAGTAYALASPPFSRGMFPDFSLLRLVAKRPSMDGREARALAAVCGVTIDNPDGRGSASFVAHLHDVLDRYPMGSFFHRDPSRAINGIDVRPRGVNPRTDEVELHAMIAWRRAYRDLWDVEQMMVATVLCLYRGDVDKIWLRTCPCKWHVADAIPALNDAGFLQDWGKLVALYLGW